jgi:hypothetical protein
MKGRRSKFKSGFRHDLGIKVRSGWEASVIRWLNYQDIEWDYEPVRFVFNAIKRGTISYTPDVYLPKYNGGTWLEIKGHIPNTDKTKIKRFKKYYPEEFKKLVVIVGKKGTEADEFFKSMGVPVMAYFDELKDKYQDVIIGWND